jgi:hypothetical protein
MKRYLRAVAAAAILTCGLGSVGCASRTGVTLEDRYRNAVDVSWPERYNYAARESVLAPFAQQAATGHFYEQTLWNWYFEPGGDKLTPGGLEKLDAIARSTPSPDPKLYIQTARDIVVTPENADRLRTIRDELNAKRAAAIRTYMANQPGAPVAFTVEVHDAPVPGIYAPFAIAALQGQLTGYKGGIGGGGGNGAPTGGTGGAGIGGVGPGGSGNTPSTTGTPGAGPGTAP